MLKKRLKPNLSNITQNSSEKRMANIGQIWPDILISFVSDYNVKLTASDASRKTKIPRRTVSRILDKLVKLNLIRYVIEGKNKKYYLDLKDQRIKLLVGFIENYKSLKFSSGEKKIFLILEEIMKLRNIVLFGSYAKGNAAAESDVDVLVIGNESKKIREIARKQIKQVNLHFSTLKEFENLLKKKNTLAIEIMKNHIVFGNSQFTELCWRFYRNEL
ncbi:MAG: nucleotidyltransferase domain-containing protein [Bacteroidetes bacterium]|nr:nucleotidyltransferase domain-containing protein [Bacteroidota bacterium]